VLVRAVMTVPMNFVGKDTLFRPPFGALFRWLGGIPVNRRVRTGFTTQLVERYRQADTLFIAIAPEGTRSHVKELKSGFYHLAVQAGVPLGLGFIDYRHRELGIGAWIDLSGDPKADMDRVRAFYADRHGRRPALAGGLCLADETVAATSGSD
jgi:1-acyl-sn-glycerol-3-phosphate acyltransferase